MSFILYDSSIAKQNASPNLFTSTNVKSAGSSSIQVFNQSLPEAETETTKEVKEDEINRNFDIDDLVKKYKKEPSKILDELGINFSDDQRKELEALLKDKKSLKSFLEIVKQDKLNANDIFTGMKKSAEKKVSGFFSRIGNVIKTAFKEGLSEAVDLAKSEKVYYAEKLGSNMNEVRTERDDFSSEGVANVAQAMVDEPEIKNSTMHFVSKEESAGKKLYTETDVTKAVEIMQENPKDAELFTANAAELEAIKDENNIIKYKGSTIINVDEKMINNKSLQPTMMNVAKKTDMIDKYLIGITDNLSENPDMQEAIDKFLSLKDSKGNDRFSAENINDQSIYMIDKDSLTINDYCKNTLDLGNFEKLNGDNIVAISGSITDNPKIKTAVYNALNSGKNGDCVQEYTSNLVNTNTEVSQEFYTPSPTEPVNTNANTNPITESAFARYKKIADKMLSEEEKKDQRNNSVEDFAQKTVIDGKTYNRFAVQYELYRRFGTASEKILQKLEKDAKFIDVIKKYGNQKIILETIAENPSLVNKLLRSSSGVSTADLAQMIPLCTNSAVTDILIKLTAKYGVSKAVSMITQAKNNNTLDQIEYIIDNGTLDRSAQKEKIESLNTKTTKQSIFNEA